MIYQDRGLRSFTFYNDNKAVGTIYFCKSCLREIKNNENYGYNPYSDGDYVKCCWRHRVKQYLHLLTWHINYLLT